MSEAQAKRYDLGNGLVLTYNRKGWAVLRDGHEFVASDLHPEGLDGASPNGPALRVRVQEVIDGDLGEPVAMQPD